VAIVRRTHTIVAAPFLAVIMAPGLIQTASELRNGEQPQALDIFRQPTTARNLRAYEQSVERASLVVKKLRPWTQYFEWRLLSDAGEKSVLGRHGWLFYRPSVGYATERRTGMPEGDSALPLAAIRSFRDELQGRGIGLLLVPVPNKESVYPEMLAKRAEGAGVIVCDETRRLLDELKQYGIEYIDLFEVFRRAKREVSPPVETRLYLARDTHWSPAGARLAAGAVAQRVLDRGTAKRHDHTFVERPVTVSRLGDLVEMLQVPQIERVVEPESLACLQVVGPGTATPYRDAQESDVLILGDSFLRIYQKDEPGAAGFIAHLARELGRPLTSIVNDGGASTLVRQELARRPNLLLNKKLVIWEFAERDIRDGTGGWKIVPLIRAKAPPR
jgi:hypothetical protein